MPINVTPRGDHLSVQVFGTICAADLLKYSQTLEAFERQAGRAMDRIANLTEVERFDISHRDVFEFADRRKHHQHPGLARAAIIATEPIQVGLARMYQTMTEHPNLEIRIVQSLEEAQAWIRDPYPAAAKAAVNLQGG